MAKKVTAPKTVSKPIPPGKINSFINTFSQKVTDYKSSKKIYFVIIVLGLLLLAFYKKNWFVAATVNGVPVTNLELQSQLNNQFRTQTLNQLVNEKIIMQEAAKMGAVPTAAEIDQKIAELETNVGGKETLDNLLLQQGQTRESLRSQLKVQIAVTKLYENEATVSAEEISKFLTENSSLLQATDSAGQQKEAEDSLKQQKLSEIFTQKFQELRQKANIKIF